MNIVNDVLQMICNHLQSIDIYHLSLTCDLYKNIFKLYVLNNLNKKITIFIW